MTFRSRHTMRNLIPSFSQRIHAGPTSSAVKHRGIAIGLHKADAANTTDAARSKRDHCMLPAAAASESCELARGVGGAGVGGAGGERERLVAENLRGVFGLEGFRPLQREAVDAVLRVRSGAGALPFRHQTL